jgi:hypothetical protein
MLSVGRWTLDVRRFIGRQPSTDLLLMRFVEPVFVTVLEPQIPIPFVTRSMLFEILLGHHV